jgi:hypothetical protein
VSTLNMQSPLNSTTTWGLGLQHMSLYETFHIQMMQQEIHQQLTLTECLLCARHSKHFTPLRNFIFMTTL